MIHRNDDNNKRLMREREISFQEIAGFILSGEYVDILENPAHPDQYICILSIQSYTWVVPFTIEQDESMFSKTAFPSRKLHKLCGGGDEQPT
jgi:hypothetical protein